jgi:hypothetical protein
MSYYILDQDPRVPAQPTVLSCPDDMKPEDWISGKRMTAPRNPLRLQMSVRTGKFRGVIVKGILTLFHDILREELIRLGIDNLQFFPVELENPEGQIETKYQLVNVIGLLDAVDKSKSVIEPRATGGRGRLRSFHIDPAAARGQHLFRIAEAPTLIVIDEWLFAKLDDFNLAGAWMLPTDEYEGY